MIDFPEPQAVLKDLSKLFPLVYSALQFGTFKAKEFFALQEEKNQKPDPFLAPDLVRYFAKQEFQNKGQIVVEDEEKDIDFENVPNNGICIHYDKYNIRVLKSVNGDLPIPGRSRARQEFYQQYQYVLPFIKNFGSESKLNLLILWDVSRDYSLTTTLFLACPKEGGETKSATSAHWKCEIPPDLLLGITKKDLETEQEEDLPLNPQEPIQSPERVNDQRKPS